MIFNIAEVDFPENWGNSVQEIAQRLKSQNEAAIISGLMALRQIFQAGEGEIEEDRDPMNQLVEGFFPILESIMAQVA